jgi:F-type H+-transporting ATPase subunit epsilon
MARLHVEIVTPERRLAQLEADEVIAPGADGLFGVRPGHAPFLALMQPGPLSVRDARVTTHFFVAGGFVEVGGSTVRVLADAAEAVRDIDVAAAQARLADCEARLKQLAPTDARTPELQQSARREAKRLEAAAKLK